MYHELTFKVYEEEEDNIKIKEYRDKEGMFVLLTSVPEEQMNNSEILREYMEQVSVEACFRVLKDPYFIDELFAKKIKEVGSTGICYNYLTNGIEPAGT